jgi:antirestriction protein ArdC
MPAPDAFLSEELYYATLFHELAHSTGHSSRLDRGLDTKLAPFGSADYSKEELVAEMAAAFLCGHTGIDPATLENQAAYLQGWIKRLKGDKRLVVQAGSHAMQAANRIDDSLGTLADRHM